MTDLDVEEDEITELSPDLLASFVKILRDKCPTYAVDVLHRDGFRVRITLAKPSVSFSTTVFMTLNENNTPGVWVRQVLTQVMKP